MCTVEITHHRRFQWNHRQGWAGVCLVVPGTIKQAFAAVSTPMKANKSRQVTHCNTSISSGCLYVHFTFLKRWLFFASLQAKIFSPFAFILHFFWFARRFCSWFGLFRFCFVLVCKDGLALVLNFLIKCW